MTHNKKERLDADNKDLSFIERAMGQDEEFLLLSRVHWIYLFQGFCWFLLFTGAGLLINDLIWEYLESHIQPAERTVLGHQFTSRGSILMWLLISTGLIILLYHIAGYLTTKIALTDKRLLMRKGLIMVNIEEIDLEEIKSEHVDHGFFGRFLNYGEIHFDARFVGDVPIPNIAQPYRLLRATHETRTALADSLAFSTADRQREMLKAASKRHMQSEKSGNQDQELEEEPMEETDDYIVYKKKKQPE